MVAPRLGWVFWMSWGWFWIASPPAWAESQEMSAARNQQAKAYQEYYQRLRHGGAGASADKLRQAYDATVAPAEREAGTAMQNEFRVSSKNAYRANRVFVAPVKVTPGAKRGAKKLVSHAAETPAPAASVSPEAYRPDTVLDGNGIAREIEFKGSKKK